MQIYLPHVMYKWTVGKKQLIAASKNKFSHEMKLV